MNFLTRHPEPRRQGAWNCLQLGLLMLPLLPTWGGILIIFGVILTWQRQYQRILQQPINQAFAILSLLLIVSACLAKNPATAFLGLGNFLPYFWVFAGLSSLIQTTEQLRHLSWLLMFPALPIVILGLGQQFLGWSGIEQLRGILGWVIILNGSPPDRMSSVFMYANILAVYLIIILILGLALLIEQIPRLQQPKGKLSVIFLSITLIGVVIALIFTESRSAWGLTLFSGLAYAIYIGWWWILGLAAAAVSAVVGAAFAPKPWREGLRMIVPAYFWQRLTDQNFERPIETLRVTQWQFAWNLTQERPLMGWGLRNFTSLYETEMNVWMGHPHSLFLMMTAEVGLPATLLFFNIIGWILTQAIRLLVQDLRSLRDRLLFFSYLLAFTACTLFNLLDVTLFDFRVNTLGWLLLAAITGVVDSNHNSHQL